MTATPIEAVSAELPTTGSPRKPWQLWIVLLIVAACFAPVVRNGMSPLDDSITICFQPRMNPPRFTADGVGWYWRNSQLDIYVPLTQTFWALLAKATYVETADPQTGFHVDVRVFHAANLLWHLLNVSLVYALLNYLLQIGARGRDVRLAAAAGALLFGLHPLQVEGIAWLSGTKDVMFVSASLASILLYLTAVGPERNEPLSRRVRAAAYLCGLVLIPIGILCKPTAMVTPLIAGVMDALILGRPLKRVLIAIAPYFLAAVPLAIVARLVQPATAVPLPAVWNRPALAGATVAFYLGKLFDPVNLAFDYAWRPTVIAAKAWFPVVGWGTVIGLGAVTVASIRRAPWVAAGVLVFVFSLLPVLGFTRFTFQYFSTVSDHYVVLSMVGVALLVGRAMRDWRRGALVAATLLVAVVGVVCGMLDVRQISFWQTPETVALHTIAVTPNSSLGHNVLGEWLENKGKWQEAEREYRAAAIANDRFFIPVMSLARLYAKAGHPEVAIDAFHLLLDIRDRYPPGARPDYDRFIPETLIPAARAYHHDADVPVYREEQAQALWPGIFFSTKRTQTVAALKGFLRSRTRLHPNSYPPSVAFKSNLRR